METKKKDDEENDSSSTSSKKCSSTTTSTPSTMKNLSRDDLIKKCKGLLNIAQKAKQAKDVCSEENNKLKEQLTKYQTQKLADKTALKTMQDVIDSLTETKLIATGKITDLESENNSIKSKLETISDKLKIENESLKRQNMRLTEENDDLLNDLQNLEDKLRKVNEMGLEQNKDLIILEKETDKWKNFQEIVDNLNEKIKIIEIENDRIKNENEYIDKERNHIIIKYGNLTDENHKLTILNSEFIEKLNEYENLQILNEQNKNESIFNYENLIELEDQINALSLEHKNAIKNILIKPLIDEENIHVNSLQEVIEKLNTKLKLLQFECDTIKFENDKQILLVEKTLDEHMHLQKEHNLSKELNNNLTIENNIIRDKFEQLELLNINVSKTVETLESDKKCLAEDNSKLINQTDHQQQKLKLYKLKLLEFSQKLKQLKSTKEILLNTVKEYSEALPKWQREILTASKIIYEKLTELEKSNSELAMQLNDIQENHNLLQINCDTKIKENEYLKEVQFKYNDLLTDHERLLLEMNEQNDIIKKYETNDIQNLENFNFKSENEILHKKIDELLCKNDELQNDNKLLESNLNDNCQKMSELQNDLISYDEKINIMQKLNTEMIDKKTHEYNELLGEMREINEAFKNRGDIISKQQQQFIELQNENAFNGATKQNAFDEIIEQKDKEIGRLLISLKELEQKCNNAVNNIDNSETLSISTISRVEDVARMRDIEDSFEEKYNKLRTLAVKLKKKVTDQNAIIANYELKNQHNVTNTVYVAAATTTNDNNTLKNQLKNLQSIQKENDRITDELEELKDENKKIKKLNDELKLNYDKCTTDLRESKNKNDDIKNEVNINSKTKATLDQAIKEYLKQIQLLKTENDKLRLTKKDLEIEVDQLKSNFLNKESELHLQKDEINKLHNDLTKIKATAKKSEILNLEMEAYEKSLKDVSQKLETKNNQNREFESTIKNLENTLTGLKNQILILEENLESEKLHSIDLKQQIDMQNLRLRESDHEKLELKIKLDEMEKEKHTIKLEIDDLRLDTSQTVSEKEKVCLLLRTENETILRNKFNMEDEINTLTLKLRNIEKELVDTKTEFANYKIRAQNVLRQNQTKETSREMELEDELNTANIAIENSESKLKLLTEHNKQLQQNYDDIKDDKNRLHERYKELLQLLDESRTLTEMAQDDNRRQMQEQQEILKTQRLHMETVNNCYKKQLNELEENHRKELTELKKMNTIMLRQSEDDEYRNRLITSVVGASSGMEHNVAMINRNTYPIPTTDEQKIDWILMERQDGEGSENTNSVLQQQQQQQSKISSTRNRRDLIPLDELLNTSFDDNQNQSTSSSASVQPLRVSPTVELQQTKDKLNVQESRVKHLTVLLAEAEQDLAKLTQLNEVLKEEVRRHERSLEREPHMHNLEYLKNVIFKFLTINNGDEKSHLVPVLNTILKLSPEETQKLQAVAKGGDGAQRGWGSYLPIWSNHQYKLTSHNSLAKH